MAGLEFKFDPKEFGIFDDIRKRFPDFRRQSMGFVGARGKNKLKDDLLSGQEITLHGMKDKKGKRKISYKVFRYGEAVRFVSYPVNLFEKKVYGGGKVIGPGKQIITKKFKSIMQNDLQKILNDFDNKVLQKEFDKI